jgi:hypothetical protein
MIVLAEQAIYKGVNRKAYIILAGKPETKI